MSVCISDELIESFLADRISDPTADEIAAHLDDCPTCQTRAEALSDDTELRDWQRAYRRQSSETCKCEIPAALLVNLHDRSFTGDEQIVSLQQVAEPGERRVPESGSSSVGFELSGVTEAASVDRPQMRRIGQYELLHEIGHGGMGTVYEAFHTKLKRRVALKVLFPHRQLNAESSERFHHEMEAVGQLDHPNIVRATDAGEADGVSYLVMEIIDGCDLAYLVDRCGTRSVAEACEIVRQSARGLEHAHARGIVHRDVKPSNLLLTRDGTVKVTDLGLARLQEDYADHRGLTGTNQIVGTIDFMSPEQAADNKIADYRSDVYSLGCVLYFLLTGKAVYDGDTPIKRIMAHRDRPIPSLCHVRADVPRKLDAVFRKMVAKDPAKRYSSMDDFILALEAAGIEPADALVIPPILPPQNETLEWSSGKREPVSPSNRPAIPLSTRLGGRRTWMPRLKILSAAIAAVLVLVPALMMMTGHRASVLFGPATDTPPDSSERLNEGPVFQYLSNDQLVPFKSYPLLRVEPETIVGPTAPGEGKHYDAVSEQLHVAGGSGLFLMATTDRDSYTIRADVRQDLEWHGAAGIFFGFHEEVNAKDGTVREVGQMIVLTRNTNRRDNREFPMLAGRYLFEIADTGVSRYVRRDVATVELPYVEKLGDQYVNRPYQLEVTVRDGQLTTVRWAGQRLPTLSALNLDKCFPAEYYRGGFGSIASLTGGVTFQNAEIIIEE